MYDLYKKSLENTQFASTLYSNATRTQDEAIPNDQIFV